jgi:sugar lactone lactonase YvrE
MELAPPATFELVFDPGAELGEGPAWDPVAGRLLFVDIDACALHELRPEDGSWIHRRIALDEPPGAVVPRVAGGFAVASRTGFLLLDEDGGAQHAIPVGGGGRMNDAKVDAHGRLWSGRMPTTPDSGDGALYRLDRDHRVTRVVTGIGLPNGMDWSPDGSRFYLVDTATRSVDVFDFDADAGTLDNRRRLLQFDDGLDGPPDGLAVDDRGDLWIAAPLDGRIMRFDPEGRPSGSIATPVTDVTSCAFGSPDGGDLYITSGRLVTPAFLQAFGLDPALLGRVDGQQHRGAVFRCRPGVSGPPARAYAG